MWGVGCQGLGGTGLGIGRRSGIGVAWDGMGQGVHRGGWVGGKVGGRESRGRGLGKAPPISSKPIRT